MTVSTDRALEVTIAIARDAALVRTARLVAAAVARRADLPEAVIEEVRLGVGEACAILIGEQSTSDGTGLVEVSLRSGNQFTVQITGAFTEEPAAVGELGLDPWALLRGATEDVRVDVADGHAAIRMTWDR